LAPPQITVIVGNGPAAVHACRALRARGYEGRIHLFSDHQEPAYNPMLTPYYLAGHLDRAACFPFGGAQMYSSLGVTAHLGRPVIGLDAEARTVELADGSRMAYDQCLVASGASPVVPAISGLYDPRVLVLRTISHADALCRAVAAGARRALVIGASLVGLKAAEALHERGLEVVLTDVAPQVLSLVAAEECARLIEEHLAQNGIELRLGTVLTAVTAVDGALCVEFKQGAPLEADLVVVATGVRPNLDFIPPGQVEQDVGLLVDEHLRTSAPGLFAAGDVAQATNLLTGRKEVVGLWANACLQGRTAGRVMAGDLETYAGSLPCNMVHLLGLTFASVGGERAGGCAVAPARDIPERRCRLAVEEGATVAGNLLGDCSGAGVLRQRIMGRTRARASVRDDRPQPAWARLREQLFRQCVTEGNPGWVPGEETT
jgi:3-phenylpropionate/trans-cinnamate dioxygenase ferredoxin reductase subunit